MSGQDGSVGANADYEIDPAEQQVSVSFAVAFNAVQSVLWFLLLVAAASFAVYRRKAVSRSVCNGWPWVWPKGHCSARELQDVTLRNAECTHQQAALLPTWHVCRS